MRMKSALLIVSLALAAAPACAAAAELHAAVSDAAGKPVPDAVIFVTGPGLAPVAPAEPYILDQINKEFVPHILPIVVGGRVRFPNRDDIHHHVYSFSQAKKFELQLYKGEPTDPVLFDREGVVKVGCNIHDWMSAVVLVLPSAHFALTDPAGRAVIAGLPERAGLRAQVFHERLKGPVEDTARMPVFEVGGRAELEWTVELKRDRRKSRSSFEY